MGVRVRAAFGFAVAIALMLSLLAGCAGVDQRGQLTSQVASSQHVASAASAPPTASAVVTAGVAPAPTSADTSGVEPSAAAVAGDAPGAVARHLPQPFDPEQLDPRVTQDTVSSTIGVSGWSAQVRPSVSVTGPLKRRLMREHGYTQPLSAYELDHFIPLGVGGSSDPSNLWLEPIAEARLKDRDEALVHRKVTDGQWTLAQGQQYIRDHWAIHYAQ